VGLMRSASPAGAGEAGAAANAERDEQEITEASTKPSSPAPSPPKAPSPPTGVDGDCVDLSTPNGLGAAVQPSPQTDQGSAALLPAAAAAPGPAEEAKATDYVAREPEVKRPASHPSEVAAAAAAAVDAPRAKVLEVKPPAGPATRERRPASTPPKDRRNDARAKPRAGRGESPFLRRRWKALGGTPSSGSTEPPAAGPEPQSEPDDGGAGNGTGTRDARFGSMASLVSNVKRWVGNGKHAADGSATPPRSVSRGPSRPTSTAGPAEVVATPCRQSDDEQDAPPTERRGSIGSSTNVHSRPPADADGAADELWSSIGGNDWKWFPKVFPEIPIPVDVYNCALNSLGFLIQGKAYITATHLCFYSAVGAKMGLSQHKATIGWADITDMSKANTAMVLPNAIQVVADGDTYFFQSFLNRNSAYRCFQRMREDVGDGRVTSGAELEALIKSGWKGSQTEDDASDTSSLSAGAATTPDRPGSRGPWSPSVDLLGESTPSLTFPNPAFVDQPGRADLISAATEAAAAAAVRESRSSVSSAEPGPADAPDTPIRHQSLQQAATPVGSDIAKTAAKQKGFVLHDAVYAADLDDVAESLFGDDLTLPTSHVGKVFARNGTTDVENDGWAVHGGENRREMRYRVKLNFSMGPSTAVTVDTRRELERSGQRMVVEMITRNPDVPYGKNYSVTSMYYLSSNGRKRTRLIVKASTKVTGAYLSKNFILWACEKGAREFWTKGGSAALAEIFGEPVNDDGDESGQPTSPDLLVGARDASAQDDEAPADAVQEESFSIMGQIGWPESPEQQRMIPLMLSLVLNVMLFISWARLEFAQPAAPCTVADLAPEVATVHDALSALLAKLPTTDG